MTGWTTSPRTPSPFHETALQTACTLALAAWLKLEGGSLCAPSMRFGCRIKEFVTKLSALKELKQFPNNVRIRPVRRNPALKGGFGWLLSWLSSFRGCLETLKRGTCSCSRCTACPGGSATFKQPVRKKCAPFGFAGFFDVMVVWVQARSSATGLNA